MSQRVDHWLDDMTRRGQSVVLTWGEDTGQWECSWITGGVRFTAVSIDRDTAIEHCRTKALGGIR
jgi:hypothetical protein